MNLYLLLFGLMLLCLILIISLWLSLVHNHRRKQAQAEQAALLKDIRTRLVQQTLVNQDQAASLTALQTTNDTIKSKLRQTVPKPVQAPQKHRIDANSRAIFRSYVVGLDYYQKEFEAALQDAIHRGYFRPYANYNDAGLKADYLYAKKYQVDSDDNIGEIQLVEEVDGAKRAVRVELKVADHGYVIGYLPKKQVNEAFNVIDIYANSVMTLSSKTRLMGGQWKMAIDAVDDLQYMNDPNAQHRQLADYGSTDTPLQIKTGRKSYFLQFTLYELDIANDKIPLYSLVDTTTGQRGSIVTVEAEPVSYVLSVEAGSEAGQHLTITPDQIDRVIWVPNWK
ncbi:hypothetical protein [Lactobacillus sp. CBA3605] [Lactiplantibacillus mudanjiangensis]|uniref:hypothetical protein n=1 Tax=Lactiplantibacillus mudanjiangensis TaxID=1296538 RepID=UPI0010142736|nr:hypothetical protein [Lactiplantibacillus mudanjiangensis]VDG33674.1 hypothetical protein [Lactobacillus sp. CBA3605] [Lactiplantibacillus mudanjiangensis]